MTTRSAALARRALPGRRSGLQRERIVAAAAELFRTRGYRGTSLGDIGAAVGTTGPAIYRHFPSKEAILLELVERAVRRSQRDVLTVLDQQLPPRETLEAIVRKAVDHVLEEADLVALADQEARHLSPRVRPRAAREQRAIAGAWMDALRAVRPELTDPEVRCLCTGAFALIRALPRGGAPPPERARALFTAAALAALLAEPAG
jgi:AcrR family transcriptional regulator